MTNRLLINAMFGAIMSFHAPIEMSWIYISWGQISSDKRITYAQYGLMATSYERQIKSHQLMATNLEK